MKKKLAVLRLREFKEVDLWDCCDSTDEDIVVFIHRHLVLMIWMNAIIILVFIIYPESTKIVKISTITFNSGEHGLETKTWSPAGVFLVSCEIDVTVNVRQNDKKPCADDSLHCRPSHCCRPRCFKDQSKFFKCSQRHMIAAAV